MATLQVIVDGPEKWKWIKGVQIWFKSKLDINQFKILDLDYRPSHPIRRFNMSDTELAELNWYGDYVVILREGGHALISPIYYTFNRVEELDEILTDGT
jgi:hypothetical protein